MEQEEINPEIENEQIFNLVNAYFTIEEIILEKLSKLSSYGKDCNCNEPNKFGIVYDDNAISWCLNCGGNISW